MFTTPTRNLPDLLGSTGSRRTDPCDVVAIIKRCGRLPQEVKNKRKVFNHREAVTV